MNKKYTEEKFAADLNEIYGKRAERLLQQLVELKGQHTFPESGDKSSALTKATLIAYADSITGGSDLRPLEALGAFLRKYLISDILPVLHLLPFYPWDTDRGFSVKNYYEVDPECGTWEDVQALGNTVDLMFDFVANHASIANPIVQKALIAEHLNETDSRYRNYAPYKDFVITFNLLQKPSDKQLALLARPRAFPVLTRYVVYEVDGEKLEAQTGELLPAGAKLLGEGYVWTTFSRGKDEHGVEQTKQVDLNFKNPDVFYEVCRILHYYLTRGARYIRLDAIGYIWKRLGSSSLHEPEAHTIIRAISYFIRSVTPGVAAIAEVNEPQAKAFTYLGSDEEPECDAVYQFTHFPLALHALATENSEHYSSWLGSLSQVKGRQFVTVLGSHDGLGLKPVRGILSDEEIDAFVATLIEEHGGMPNYAKLPGGREIVYEVCGTPWQLVNAPKSGESLEVRLAKYAAVIRLGFLVRGMPAIYINGLFGAQNFIPPEGLDENRTVNREKYNYSDLQTRLQGEYRAVFGLVSKLLAFRNAHKAFHCLDQPAVPLEVRDKRVLFCHIPASNPDESLYLIQSLSAESIDFKNAMGDIVTPQFTAPEILHPYEGFWFDERSRY